MMLSLCLIGLALAGAEPLGQIAFVAGTEQEDQCVCLVDPASGAVVRVGPGALDGAPVWSPDGTRLAFQTRQPEGIGICIGHADGSEPQRLAHKYKWNRNPRWSPEGGRLAYEANDGERPDQRIMVYDLSAAAESPWGGDKTGLLRPVWLPNMKILRMLRPDEQVSWSDTENKIAGTDWLKGLDSAIVAVGLGSGEKGALYTDLYVVTPTTAATPMARVSYVEWAVEPSPDGWNIAFESNDGGDREIFIVAKNATADISNHRAADWNPTWSPDAQWIAFESFRGGRRGVYRVFPETARVSPIAADPEFDNWAPSWSPDGKWIAFVSNRTGRPQIFIAEVTGEDARQITDLPGFACAPAWRPKGEK